MSYIFPEKNICLCYFRRVNNLYIHNGVAFKSKEQILFFSLSPTHEIVIMSWVFQNRENMRWNALPVTKCIMLIKLVYHWVNNYSTGVQIVSCTLSDDSVLSESTGLFNPVLCVSQWNLFWQKNQPMRLCLSNQVRSAREWFPSPLGDFIRLFEGLIGELFQIWHWNMFYFFKWHQSGP